MLSPETTPSPATAHGDASRADGISDVQLTMELLELELVLDSIDMERPDFTGRVRKAASTMGGTFLFDLPASGLIEDCSRIAVLRIPKDGTRRMATVFVCLDAEATGFRIAVPNENTAGLARFAEAFVDVLERMS